MVPWIGRKGVARMQNIGMLKAAPRHWRRTWGAHHKKDSSMQRIVRIFTVALASLLLIAAPPANGQEGKETACEGKFKGGKQPTSKEISKILKDHAEWSNSARERGQKANLCGANLREANLSKADLAEANLSRAYLGGGKPERGLPGGGEPERGQPAEG